MMPTLEGRSERTRAALLRAFVALIFREGFKNISIGAIVAEAGTARSTFYEHFSNKDDLLRASMSHFFRVMAQCVTADAEPPELGQVFAHFWENRRLTDAVFSGAPRRIIAQSLGEMIEARLHERFAGKPLRLPYRLAAIQLAEAQLALVESWLRGRAFARVEDMAAGLHTTTRASADALVR